MKLITTVTYTLEQEYDENYFNKEEAMRSIEQDFIGRIETRIDNLCLSNWSRDSINMRWEE